MSTKSPAGPPAEDEIAVGVSACLLGEKVRYDGGHKHDKEKRLPTEPGKVKK